MVSKCGMVVEEKMLKLVRVYLYVGRKLVICKVDGWAGTWIYPEICVD